MESKLAGFAILLLLHVAMAIPTLDGMKEGSEIENTPEKILINVDEIAVEYFTNATEKFESIDEIIRIYKMKAEKGNSKDGSQMTEEHFDSERVRRHIFGNDERLPVPDTSSNPYCAIGRIDYGCTAVFIGPYHALTAAHCVYNRTRRTWRSNLNIYRGRTCTFPGRRMIWRRVRAVTGYVNEGKPEYDYALIIYDSRNPSPCWLSFGYNEAWSNVGFDVVGYPLDKGGCTYQPMWFSSCHYSTTAHQGLSLAYRCNTAVGNDGSALYGEWKGHPTPGRRAVYGVNAYQASNGAWNFGPRINLDRYNQIVQWMVESGYCPTTETTL